MKRAAFRLLTPDEPAPQQVLRAEGASDFFLTADHAGATIPRRLGTLGLPQAELSRHIAWDIGIAGVTKRLSALLDAAAVLQTYSRLVVDCNRAPGRESSIPRVSDSTMIPGNHFLSPTDLAARYEEIFAPYHDCIATLLDRRARVGRRGILIAMHSFTPVFGGVERPMHVGVLYNRDPRLAHHLLALLRAEAALVVTDNEPYSVSDETDYTIPVHGERRGLPHVEIEIRQDLISDEAGQAAWAERLARVLVVADGRLREETV
jgi:predicted N-formylglutamate amidohydrolase